MFQDGLHGLRPDWSRCAAGLVAAHEQAAVVNVHSAGLLADPLVQIPAFRAISSDGSESSPWGIHATGWAFWFTREGACFLRPRVPAGIFENAATIYDALRRAMYAPRHVDKARRANAKESGGKRRGCRDIREGEYGQHEDRKKTR